MGNAESGIETMGGTTKNWDKHFMEVSEKTVETKTLAFKKNSKLTLAQRNGLKTLLKNAKGKKAFRNFLEDEATGLSFWLNPANLAKFKENAEEIEGRISSKYQRFKGGGKFVNRMVSMSAVGAAANKAQFAKGQESVINLMAMDQYPRFLKSSFFEKLREGAPDLYEKQQMYKQMDFVLDSPLQWLLRFAEVSEKVYETICISDPTLDDCPIVFVNDAFKETTGYSKGEVLGRNCRFLQGPETAVASRQQIREDVESSQATNVKLLNYRKNGEKFWNLLSMKPVKLKGSEEARFVVAIQFDLSIKRTPLELFQLKTCLDLIPDYLEVRRDVDVTTDRVVATAATPKAMKTKGLSLSRMDSIEMNPGLESPASSARSDVLRSNSSSNVTTMINGAGSVGGMQLIQSDVVNQLADTICARVKSDLNQTTRSLMMKNDEIIRSQMETRKMAEAALRAATDAKRQHDEKKMDKASGILRELGPALFKGSANAEQDTDRLCKAFALAMQG